jgi:hypothetical protein
MYSAQKAKVEMVCSYAIDAVRKASVDIKEPLYAVSLFKDSLSFYICVDKDHVLFGVYDGANKRLVQRADEKLFYHYDAEDLMQVAYNIKNRIDNLERSAIALQRAPSSPIKHLTLEKLVQDLVKEHPEVWQPYSENRNTNYYNETLEHFHSDIAYDDEIYPDDVGSDDFEDYDEDEPSRDDDGIDLGG